MTDFLNKMTCKPESFQEIAQVNISDIPDDYRLVPQLNMPSLFPNANRKDWLYDTFQVKYVPERFTFLAFDQTYLVDTRGYDYMKYICEITY